MWTTSLDKEEGVRKNIKYEIRVKEKERQKGRQEE